MGMTPDEFFDSFVKGNYCDFIEHPGCVRRAFNAAVSASHLADHYFTYFRIHNPSKICNFKKIDDFIKHLSEQTDGSFRDIRSISNAYKHLYTSRNPKTKIAIHSSIPSTGAIESIEVDNGSEKIKIAEEWSTDSKSKVIFTRKDGKQLEFLPVLDKVIKYWERKF